MKRKLIGFIVLLRGTPLISRKRQNGALDHCRKGEAPDLFHSRKDVDFLIQLTNNQRFATPKDGDFQVIPIKYPVVKTRLVK